MTINQGDVVTLQRIEVGLVSADEALVDFFAAVFRLEQLPSITSGTGIVYRLQAPSAMIKVMVPSAPPTATEPAGPFFAVKGLRYLTMHVSDLDGALERATARGGLVQHGPADIGPGVRVAVLQDPDGNAIELLERAS